MPLTEPRGTPRRNRRVFTMVALVGFAVALFIAGCSSSTQDQHTPSLPPPTEPPPTTEPPEPEPEPEPAPAPEPEQEPDTQPEPIVLAEGDDFQAAVDAAPEGTTFIIESGVHRLQQVRPKDGMTFEGVPGAVLSGAIELDDWAPTDSGVWRLDGIAMTAVEQGVCIDGYDGCKLTQDLYVDDVMLWQVTDMDDLESGRWFWSGESIFVADDPASRRVELSLATYAFVGNASNVTIRGVVVEKYAVPAQFGAIQASDPSDGSVGRGWLIEDSEIRLNHGVGVRTGEETILRRLYIHQNGQLGIAGSGGTGGVVEDSEIANNNIAGFKWEWEGGGAKFTNTVGLVVRRNVARDNEGPGLWTDIDNLDTLYEDNVVTGNSGPGIYHEISFDAVIRNNTVTGNGFGSEAWLWGSGILVAASSNVEIYGNTVTGNADGIGGIQQDREDGSDPPHLLANLYVYNNTISVENGHIGVVEDVGDDAVFTDRNIRFEANTYVGTTGQRYEWLGGALDAAGWQAVGQDLDGVWK